jgi:hypothetical protein
MPPKCCTEDPIPPRSAQNFFTNNFIDVWNRKWFEGLVKNPAYCPRTECGALIFPGPSSTKRERDPKTMIFPYAEIKAVWRCRDCHKKMCVVCNEKAHSADLPCVGEKIRAQNARFYARSGPHMKDGYIARIIAQNKYKDKMRRIASAPRLDERRNGFWTEFVTTLLKKI